METHGEAVSQYQHQHGKSAAPAPATDEAEEWREIADNAAQWPTDEEMPQWPTDSE